MEKGIKQRKRKRNRVIACCIPLCLCLLVLSVVNPYLPSNSGTAPEGNMNHTPETAPATGSHDLSVEVSIDRTGLNSSVKEQDAEKVNVLYILLSETLVEMPTQNESLSGYGNMSNGSVSNNELSESTRETACYTFVFSGSDGEEVFRLNGNVLSKDNSSKKIILSDADCTALVTAIQSIIELKVDPE